VQVFSRRLKIYVGADTFATRVMSVKLSSSPSSGSSGLIQRHVWVSGVVQGVGFRASTLEQAHAFRGTDLRGFVKNLADGRVEAVFSGGTEAVLALVAWCRQGPSSARVTRLEVREESVDPTLPPFDVRS
jgi:acylphosphatase